MRRKFLPEHAEGLVAADRETAEAVQPDRAAHDHPAEAVC